MKSERVVTVVAVAEEIAEVVSMAVFAFDAKGTRTVATAGPRNFLDLTYIIKKHPE